MRRALIPTCSEAATTRSAASRSIPAAIPVNVLQRGLALTNRQVGKVDVDRQAGHVPIEQVDGCAALEGEDILRRDIRQDAQHR